MQVKELNRKILHNSSIITPSEHTSLVTHCYQVAGNDASKMEACMKKWKEVYDYLGSEEMLLAYGAFFRASKGQ